MGDFGHFPYQPALIDHIQGLVYEKPFASSLEIGVRGVRNLDQSQVLRVPSEEAFTNRSNSIESESLLRSSLSQTGDIQSNFAVVHRQSDHSVGLRCSYDVKMERQESTIFGEQRTNYMERLPTETLVEIFFHCIPFDAINFHIYPHPYIAPMLLCCVCVHWREVALSTPMLWASTYVDSWRSCHSNRKLIYALWLERSQACPLSFCLIRPEHDESPMNDVFALFLDNLHRWRDVTLWLSADLCEQFLAIPPGGAPVLERLELEVDRCTAEQTNQLPIILSSLTNLRQLNFTSRKVTPLLAFPWSQLTHIRIRSFITMDICVGILTQCSRLVGCDIATVAGPSGLIPVTNSTLPELRVLDIRSSWELASLFNCLTCPSLRALYIHHSSTSESRDLCSFNDFLVRSRCELVHFGLNDQCLLEDYLAGYLVMPPLRSLQTLDVTCYNITDRTLHLLEYRGSGEQRPILPRLESLYLKQCHSSDGVFADMIASRWYRQSEPILGIEALATLKLTQVTFRTFSSEQSPTIPYCKEDEERAILFQRHERDIARLLRLSEEGLNLTWSISSL